jgi:hypothetical protein
MSVSQIMFALTYFLISVAAMFKYSFPVKKYNVCLFLSIVQL